MQQPLVCLTACWALHFTSSTADPDVTSCPNWVATVQQRSDHCRTLHTPSPQATGKQIVFVSRCIVIAFGILSGVLAIVLMKIGLSLGWVYLVSHGFESACLHICSCVGVVAHGRRHFKSSLNGVMAGCLNLVQCSIILCTPAFT
jgi:hypothetical protein